MTLRLRNALLVTPLALLWHDATGAAELQQSTAADALEEIVVVGTRRRDRSILDTAVPVDLLKDQDLASVPSPELLEVLTALVPSFTVGRYALGDGASFIRPPTMRGLDAGKTLVLVNGKRRHRGALVTGGFGSQGPDFASIPGIALRNVEILRDGASALYGSDAIAGVMNFNLKNAPAGGEIRAQYGQYSLGAEDAIVISANTGLPIGDSGFFNISAEWSDEQQTSRGQEFDRPIGSSGLTPAQSVLVAGSFDHDGDPMTPVQQRFGPDAVTEVYADGQLVSIFAGSDGIPDDPDTRFADNIRHAELGPGRLVQPWGRPDREALAILVNAGYSLSDTRSLYGWASYSDSDTDRNSAYRRPGVPSLLLLRTADGEIYDPRGTYPAGFTPRFFGKVIDQSFVAGLKGEAGALTYDLSARRGSSEIQYRSKNTLNPSLGPESPTSFRPGELVSDESGLAADFATPVSLGKQFDSTLAFGIEYRTEGYAIEPGDPMSYAVGPYAAVDPWGFETSVEEAAAGENGGVVECRLTGLESIGAPCPAPDPIHNVVPVGSDGFPGFSPLFASDYDRDSWSIYADLETDVSENFLVAIAARYEDFSDFGDNLSTRLAMRYAISERFRVRGSIGTGFRAPTPGQISTISVQTRFDAKKEPVLQGIFPPTHVAAEVFGAEPLTAETSDQWTLGLVATPGDDFTLTLDYYQIEIDDRVVLTSRFSVRPDERAILLASGVPGGDSIQFVRFYTNDIDTRTSGVDLVATYAHDWRYGTTALSVNANWNRTEVTRRTPRQGGPVLDEVDVFNIRNGPPTPRAIVSLRHAWRDGLSMSIRGNWYGSYKIQDTNNPGVIQGFDSMFQVDARLTWRGGDDDVSVTLGGNNIFDARPDPAEFGICCGAIVRHNSVMDWQGPFFYLRATLPWQ